MESTAPTACPRCGLALEPGAVVCPECRALVYGDELRRLSTEARAFEDSGQSALARRSWQRCLPMLPPESAQAQWIRQHTGTHISAATSPPPAWLRKLGPLAPLAIILLKAKTIFLALFKLKFLFSFFTFFALYWAMWGWRFGLGFALMILLHELGHYVDIRRRGLPADMPVFLPGLGAYVRWQAMGVSMETRAAISLAGPFAGTLASAVAALLWLYTGNQLFAALAYLNAVITVLNLIPVWMLDGAQAAKALGRSANLVLLTLSLALWTVTGRMIFAAPAAGFAWRLLHSAWLARQRRQSANGAPPRILANDVSSNRASWNNKTTAENSNAAKLTGEMSESGAENNSTTFILIYYAALLIALAVMLYALPTAQLPK